MLAWLKKSIGRISISMTGLSNRRSVMTLYADTSDPLGHSVRLVLREKDINSNVVLVPDGTRPEILNDFNPYDTTLTLVIET